MGVVTVLSAIVWWRPGLSLKASSAMSIDDDVRRWEATAPEEMRSDVLWTAAVFRYACYATDRLDTDLDLLAANPKTIRLVGQLSEAIGSISANFAEGYSRASARDRCRIYEYSLGSAREARQWIFQGRHALGDERARYAIALLTKIIRMLTTIIKNERAR